MFSLFFTRFSPAGVPPGCSLLFAVTLGLSGCSGGYEVTLNDRVVYDPLGNPAAQRAPDLLADAGLQGCLNRQLETRQTSPEELTLLACTQAGITTLQGLSSLANLEQVELSDNGLVDIGELSRLEKLSVVNMRNNAIRDIRALQSLPLLRFVSLQGNDTIPCAQLDQLESKPGIVVNRPLSCGN